MSVIINRVKSKLSKLRHRLIGSDVFSSSHLLRSDSDNGRYLGAVTTMLNDEGKFRVFKRSIYYQEILEHLTYDQGHAYLKVLLERDNSFLKTALDSALICDELGSPVKYRYPGIDPLLSPTTLRYVKVASDLKNIFGCEFKEVAEIGCGYGGQALVNDTLLKIGHSTLFDLPAVNKLIEKYIESHLLNGSYETTTINQHLPKRFDLVLSNYAFSELSKPLQLAYIRKVLLRSDRGYLTMNSGVGGWRSLGKLSLAELRSYLPGLIAFRESPPSGPHNYVAIWGVDSQSIQRHVNFIPFIEK